MSEAVACTLLAAHSTIHMAGPPRDMHNRNANGPKYDRPKVDIGITLEEWNMFTRRWEIFAAGSQIDATHLSFQLFQCAGVTLGDRLLKSDPSIVTKPTTDLISAMKSLAVIAVAIGVTRAELTSMRQERDESFRSFAARVRGKAETCAYRTKCSCLREVDFTDCIIRDVLITGIADSDIRLEILGADAILERPVNEVISLVEGKEMARNAISPSTAGISSFKRSKATLPSPPVLHSQQNDRTQTARCPDCKKPFAIYTEGARGWNTLPHRQCITYYRAQRSVRGGTLSRGDSKQINSSGSEIGALLGQVSSLSQAVARSARSAFPVQVLAHHIFTKGEWKKARFLNHPKIELTISVNASDYRDFGRRCPMIKSTTISALAGHVSGH